MSPNTAPTTTPETAETLVAGRHYLSSAEAGRALKLSTVRVLQLRTEAKLTGIYWMGRWLFDLEEVERLAAERAAAPATKRAEGGPVTLITWKFGA